MFEMNSILFQIFIVTGVAFPLFSHGRRDDLVQLRFWWQRILFACSWD